jgi:murein DD-endopeptidase MepM/ murein hydrolase activator NlpD
MMPPMRGLLKKLTSKLILGGVVALLVPLTGCRKSEPPPLPPYFIKTVKSAPILLPTQIIQDQHGTERIRPSVWSAKTADLSDGMPQLVIVKKGDSLASLSQKYAVPLALIIEKNKLKAPFSLKPGQKLTLMGPKIHIVQQDENLYEIATQHKVPIKELIKANNLPSEQFLQTGQQLVLPAKTSLPVEEQPVAEKPLTKTPADISLLKKEIPTRAGLKFGWPLRGHLISKFGPKGPGLYNDGINLSAAAGTKVVAADNGVVVYLGNDIKSYGNLVLVKHQGGWMSAYAHLEGISVHKGQTVKRNEPLGSVGQSGFVKHPQLHFELRRNGKPQDPLTYLEAKS